MMKINKKIALALFLFGCTSVYAVPFAGDSVIEAIKTAMGSAAGNIASTAIIWLGAFASLQLVVTNFSLLKSGGDIDAVFAKLIGSFAWIGFCVYVLENGSAFIDTVGHGIFGIVVGGLLSGGDILIKALALAGKLFAVSLVGAAIPLIGNTLGPFINYTLIFFMAVSVLFAFKIFMVQLELGLIVMLAPLSFSFLGLNALKEQGIAPFKALISLTYRIILMMVIMKAFGGVDSIIGDAVSNYAQLNFASQMVPSNIGDLANGIISGIIAYMLLAYLLFKSDSIAASLASGSTNMGTADVASAAAMGVAAGAAMASGGAATAGAATKPVQSMANFMQGLRGGGSVSNASSQGMGGATSALPLSPTPVASLESGSSGGPGAEAATPAFETNKAGAPMNPDPNANVAGPADSGAVGGGGNPVAAGKAAATAAGAKAIESGNAGPSGDAGAPITPSEAAQTPSTGADTPATASPTSPGVADTSLQSPHTGSGSSAGVGGAGSATDQKFDKLMDHLAAQQGGGKKTFGDHLSGVNQHIAQEKAHTSVTISTHHSD